MTLRELEILAKKDPKMRIRLQIILAQVAELVVYDYEFEGEDQLGDLRTGSGVMALDPNFSPAWQLESILILRHKLSKFNKININGYDMSKRLGDD